MQVARLDTRRSSIREGLDLDSWVADHDSRRSSLISGWPSSI